MYRRRYQYDTTTFPVVVPPAPAAIFPSWFQAPNQPLVIKKKPSQPLGDFFFVKKVQTITCAPVIDELAPQMPIGNFAPNMPFLFIRRIHRFSADPSCGQTGASPANLPPNT
jgi:hypothetical protein